jgi:hypothetical protein
MPVYMKEAVPVAGWPLAAHPFAFLASSRAEAEVQSPCQDKKLGYRQAALGKSVF